MRLELAGDPVKQLITLLLLGGIFWFGWTQLNDSLQRSIPTASVLESNPDLTIDGMPVLEVIRFSGAEVVDGDSLKIQIPNSEPYAIRLAAIDAPEWQQSYGQESAAYLDSLTGGKELIAWRTGTDQYGRALAFLFIEQPDGNLFEINSEMVRAGYAWHYRELSSNSVLDSLEYDARSSGIGLWNSNQAPIPPWEFRRAK